MNPNITQAFNQHFIELFDDILTVFPDDTEVIDTKKMFILLKKTNPKLPLRTWKECISKVYKTEIENDDITFFLNFTYDKTNKNISEGMIEKLVILQKPVCAMDENNRAKVMNYIKNLTKISNLY